MNFIEKYIGGYIHIGPITIYGENAMHWGVSIYTKKWGYVCFRLPLPSMGRWWPLYFYVSPNATPWASTFYVGDDKREKILSTTRRIRLGHNFDEENPVLAEINGWVEKW